MDPNQALRQPAMTVVLFTNEKAKTQRSYDMPKVTQLVRGIDGI